MHFLKCLSKSGIGVEGNFHRTEILGCLHEIRKRRARLLRKSLRWKLSKEKMRILSCFERAYRFSKVRNRLK